MNHLDKKNCNKAKCKTCIFHPNQQVVTPDRMNEITTYLATGESSHICHTTNLTCYGALEFQATIFFRLGLIPEENVDSLLETAKQILKL